MSVLKNEPIRDRSTEAGFGMTLIAITIAIVMGISVATYLRQLSNQALQFQDMYAGSQAKWTAMSGLEYGLYKAELGEADITGSYSFYNSTITLDTLESDPAGYALPEFNYTILSRGILGSAYRDFRVFSKKSMKTIWGDVSIIEGTNDFTIRASSELNDSLYIGQNVSVQSGTPIGDPPGTPTHLYHATGTTVSGGQEDAYFTSGIHPKGQIFNPDFNTDPYDSLLAIAAAITSTSGNKFDGNKRFRKVIINLAAYDSSTIFCKGKFTFQGCDSIYGGTPTRPGVIVATTDIIAEKRSGIETVFGDNIVLIAGDDISMLNATTFGYDHSALDPEFRPSTLNLMYAVDYILIQTNTVVWSQTFASDDVRINGALYGIVYAPDKLTFSKADSYLEGAIFAVKVVGSGGQNRLDRGQMVLNHYFNEDYFKTFDFGVIPNSLLEY